MATLTDSTNLTGTITLSKATGTKVTLDTDKKYLTKDIELTINAPSSTITTNGATVSYTNGWVNAGSTTVTDSNLIPANIVNGVTIFGVTGNYTGVVIDETPDGNGGTITTITTGVNALKTQGKIGITPLTTSQTITPDSGYNALSSVQINAIPSNYIIPEGSKTITSNGDNIDVTAYASVNVSVASSSSEISLQEKTGITPTESSQTITPDSGYDALSSVQINAISSTYIGSGITQRSSTDLTASGATVSVPAGYYAENASKAVTSGSATTPATSVTANPTISVNASGLITATASATKSVTPTVSAGYVSSGTAGTITVSGSNTSQLSTQAAVTATPSEEEQTIVAAGKYTTGAIKVAAISSTYVGSGITSRDGTDLTASGATVTVPAGYYAEQASKSVTTMTLPTSAASSATSGYTSKATISRSTSAQYINIPPGYNSAGGYYTISATPNGTATAPSSISGSSASITTGTNTITLTKTVSVTPNVSTAGYISSGTAGNSSVSLTASVTVNPTPTASGATVTIPAGYYSAQTTKSVSSGSATGPSTVSGTSATVSTGTNTITLTKTNVTTTPTVSAGYVSSATASTATVTLTASVTTKAAATITPGTSNQTIASGTYLTGTQTIAGDADLVASNIISTANIFGVQGSVVINKYYTGSSAPASNLGNNGDIYLQE